MPTSTHPDYASPPGETLSETIQAMGLSQTELARRMGRPIKTVNEIIQRKASLTPDTSIELERVLGIPASFWNGLEANYREMLARQKASEHLEVDEVWLSQLPIAAMQKRNWICKTTDKRVLTEEILRFFGCAKIESWRETWMQPTAAYRKSQKLKCHEEALAAWLCKAETEGRKQQCAAYNEGEFKSSLARLKKATLLPVSQWPGVIQKECNAVGVAYVILPELPKTPVSGAARLMTSDRPLIVQTGRYKDDGHFWFTFFHEARHVLQGKLKREWLVEYEGKDDLLEKDADRFAREFLIPTSQLRQKWLQNGRKFSIKSAEDLAAELGIARGIVVGRLQYDHMWKPFFGNQLKRHYTIEDLLGSNWESSRSN